MKDDYYWFWINNITGIANIKLRYLFKVFDTPEDIYKASDKMFEGVMGIKPDDIYSIKESRKSEYIYREYSELDKKNIKFTYPGKYNYPERLMNIYDYPYIIYYKGSLPQSDVPSVAIVGARNCTEYGRSVAGRFAEDFADMGIQVISGMALGIDAAAQKGAVRKGGYSMAVLGISVIGTASSHGTLEAIGKCRGDKKLLVKLQALLDDAGYEGGKLRICHAASPAI